MRAAGNWKDYELLDTSDGERLERWGCGAPPAAIPAGSRPMRAITGPAPAVAGGSACGPFPMSGRSAMAG